MSDYNKMRSAQLGMNLGTANNRLRKAIIFDLVCKTEQNVCFQCGDYINNIDDLSIEHKEPWLYAENAKDLFFNLDNIAFSHLKCNIGAGRRPVSKYKSPKEKRKLRHEKRWNSMTEEERKEDRKLRYDKYKC